MYRPSGQKPNNLHEVAEQLTAAAVAAAAVPQPSAPASEVLHTSEARLGFIPSGVSYVFCKNL